MEQSSQEIKFVIYSRNYPHIMEPIGSLPYV